GAARALRPDASAAGAPSAGPRRGLLAGRSVSWGRDAKPPPPRARGGRALGHHGAPAALARRPRRLARRVDRRGRGPATRVRRVSPHPRGSRRDPRGARPPAPGTLAAGERDRKSVV